MSTTIRGRSKELFGAVKRGDVDKVKELLELDQVPPNDINSDGEPPLFIALAEGHSKVVEVLLKYQANPSYKDKAGNTALHVVAGKGNYDALRVFLKTVQLPEINHQNKEGNTALMVPATRGYSVVLECLLQHNAAPNIPNHVGRTPIMAAAGKGHKEVIKVLLKHGADVLLTSHEDYSGMPTALNEALSSGSPEVITCVAQACNKAMETVKRLFTCKTREDIQKQIEAGCSVNQRRGDGYTPLMMHAESGSEAVVTCLLEAHAFVDAQDKSGQTALMKSSLRREIGVVRILVKEGALINIRCTLGRIALMYGAEGGSVEVVKHLTMSGADSTISDNRGCTAEKIARENNCTEVLSFLVKKSTQSRTETDPFIAKISEYLQTKKGQPTSPQHQQMASGTKAGSSPSSHRKKSEERRTEKDEEQGVVTKELHAQMKRVAELETRVEELTIHAEFKVMDEEDLSHYKDQPDRLIDEFKKMKLAKTRAEKFSIEAKQSAQKASVELSRIKEDLVREKHGNELKVKSMMSEMEQTLIREGQHDNILTVKSKTDQIEISLLKRMIQALEQRKNPDDIKKLKVEGRHVFSLMEVYKLIINGEKRTRFKIALVCFTGLPHSGKTTLVENMIPNTEAAVKPVKGLVMYEIGFMPLPKDSMWSVKWEEFKREEIYIYMLARALAEETKEKHQLPSLEEWSDDKFPRKNFASDHLRNQFKRIYTKIRDELLNISESDYFHVILDPTYILLNVWDIGVSKALFEALPLLARMTNPLVLVNLLDLSRDYGKKLREKPALLEEHREQSIMKGRSRCHYYVRIAGLSMCDSGSILIATNKDKVLKNEVEMRKRLIEAGVRAKASDMGVTKALSPEILAIDANNEEDCTKVKKHLENFVNSATIFDQNLHLTWIFLRTALVDYEALESDFRMPRSEFNDLALQCGLKTEQEIEECLKFFTKVGSLLYHTEFLRDNVIYRIDKFFVKLNELYVAHKRESHAKQSLERGILCRAVARELWDNDTDFVWLLVQDAGIAAATVKNESPENKYDYNITCPCVECSEKDCLYIPSLRKLYKDRSQKVKTDSLFITFNGEYVPTDIQAIIVKYMRTESCIPQVQLKLTKCYNSTEFKLPNNGGQFCIIVHGDVVEIETDETVDKNVKILSILKNLCITILDAVIEYFPGFKYELGFLCTCSKIEGPNHPERKDIHYLHFLPSQYDTHLYCQHCENMIELRQGQLNWMAAVFKGIESPKGLHEARIVDERELEEIGSHMLRDHYIIPDYYIRLCAIVGMPSPQSISPAMLSANLVTGLKKWQLESASNRWEKLARILLNIGCYKAALKLDAKLIYERRPVPPDEQALSPMEVETICNHMEDWKALATALPIPQNSVRDIERECRRGRDCCRRVLYSETVDRKAVDRKCVIQALNKMEYYSLAKGIECGYI